MKFILIALLLLPPVASAEITEQEIKVRREAANKAAGEADSEMPPCAGHDHLDGVVRRFEPPKTCPKARELFAYFMKTSQEIRDNCRDATHWIENRLRNPVYCASEPSQISARKTLSALREKAINDDPEFPESITKLLVESGIDPDFRKEDKPGKDEFARRDCHFAVSFGLQFIRRQKNMAQKHYGMANYAFDAVCEDPSEADDYLKFIRGGMDSL